MSALLALEIDLEIVAQASSGPEAVVAARTHRPDVAVLDLQMPGIDGIAAAREFLRDDHGCSVLLVTSHGVLRHLKHSLDAGVRRVVTRHISDTKHTDALRTHTDVLRYLAPL